MWIKQSQSGLDLLGTGLGRTLQPDRTTAFQAPQPLFASTEFSAVNADQTKIRSTKNEDKTFPIRNLRILLTTASALRLMLPSLKLQYQYSTLQISKFSALWLQSASLPPASRVALLHASPWLRSRTWSNFQG